MRGQPRQLRLEQPPDLGFGDAARPQLVHRRGHDGLAGPQPVGELLLARRAGDERARAVPQLDHALVLELAVRLGDRVGIDHELLRERPDAGQLVARPQRAGFDGVLHLLHQLQVDGHARRGIGPEDHAAPPVACRRCELYY